MRRPALILTGLLALLPRSLRADAAEVAEAPEAPEDAERATLDPAPPPLVFPIPGVERAGPHFKDGEFGAYRPGRRKRRDCGRGHCGIDLCAPEGTAVIAVKAGVVAQIDRSPGGRGGRWIRVAHQDGTATWYMHLAGIRDGLAAGDHVHAGETLATLGRTGVSSGPTHLHFALTVGNPGKERHLDPGRLLGRATLVAAPVFPAPPSITSSASPLPEL